MWLRFLCLSACLFVICRCDAASMNKMLMEHYQMIMKLLQCDHESGEDARCVKKSLCNYDASDPSDFIERTVQNDIDGGCKFAETCCPEEDILKTSKLVAREPQGCGYSKAGGTSLRAFTDNYGYAEYAEFPWIVALLKKRNHNNIDFKTDNIGGGTLIHPSVVITVAHKVWKLNKDKLVIRAGEWNTTTDNEANRHQEREVENIVTHPEFIRKHDHNDVALLILKTPFELNEVHHIGVACLERHMPPVGTRCFGTGWGRDFKIGEENSAVLKKINLPLFDDKACQNMYRNTRLGHRYELHNSLTCAGGERDVDTCVGDGGSPLMCYLPGKQDVRYTVVGMVVYGLECGTENLPGVYAKIPHVYDWVIREMGKLGFNKTFEYVD